MNHQLEVSFNSPQCGWMSIGFEYEEGEFHTTTAAAPHTTALSDVLSAVKGLISESDGYRQELKWNRDPEEYDFLFGRESGQGLITVTEFPTGIREDGELVFDFRGDPLQIAESFIATFQQMYEERDIDEFEENWNQPFPYEAFEALKSELASRKK